MKTNEIKLNYIGQYRHSDVDEIERTFFNYNVCYKTLHHIFLQNVLNDE